MATHVLSRRSHLLVYLALLGLTGLTVAGSFLHLGAGHIAVALAIASAKAVLVVLFFMHVWSTGRLIPLVIAAALLWLGILLGLTFSDYLTRSWISNSPF